MHRHLITVKVRVKGGTDKRVQLDGTALYQHGLECLDAQTVQGWCAVQQHGVILNHLFEYIPHFRLDALYETFGTLDIVCEILLHQFAHDKWLEQLQGHTFWQAALMQFEFWPHHDNRTARVVNAFTEQVLTETTLFTLEHIGKAFELVVARASHGT